MSQVDETYQFIRTECTRINISSDAYRVGDDATIEQGELAFDNDGAFWRVYVIERGKEYGVAKFENSIDAIRYFFMKLCTGPDSFTMPKINFKDLP